MPRPTRAAAPARPATPAKTRGKATPANTSTRERPLCEVEFSLWETKSPIFFSGKLKEANGRYQNSQPLLDALNESVMEAPEGFHWEAFLFDQEPDPEEEASRPRFRGGFRLVRDYVG